MKVTISGHFWNGPNGEFVEAEDFGCDIQEFSYNARKKDVIEFLNEGKDDDLYVIVRRVF